jgi:4-hydroxy-4-methyl-2-oxoglutarate aldolase
MDNLLRLANDPERFDWIRAHLYVPAVCDTLDSLGYRDQAMHQRLRPLDPANCTIVGRARTMRWMETDYVVESDPYGLEIEALDSLKPGDVAVHSTDHGGTNAPWGELMSTVAQRLPSDYRSWFPRVLHWYPPAGQHGPWAFDGLRCAGALRRRTGTFG